LLQIKRVLCNITAACMHGATSIFNVLFSKNNSRLPIPVSDYSVSKPVMSSSLSKCSGVEKQNVRRIPHSQFEQAVSNNTTERYRF